MRKPYYKKSHNCWYVEDANRKPIRLDPDERIAHEMWLNILDLESDLAAPKVSFYRLAEGWADDNAKDTANYRNTASYVKRFCLFIGRKPAEQVSKRDVLQWLDEPKPGQLKKDGTFGPSKPWRAPTRRTALAAVKGVYNWALAKGYVRVNPVADLKVAKGNPRNKVITPEQHRQLLEAAHPALRTYLLGVALSGTRPGNVREVRADHVSPDFKTWTFWEHKTDSSGKSLTVYLSPCLQTLTRILVAARPSGPLFRNLDGRPWKKDTLSQAVRRLRERVGLPEHVVLYGYRHTFATDALLSGVPIAEVSQLLGHTDTRMVSQVYGHLGEHRDHLLEAARRARGS